MKVLAFDTSNRPMSVALLNDDQVVAKQTTATQLNHSVQLMPTISALMTEQGWRPQDLDRVVVADGPGSYTGLRIAVTTAKTLAATLNLELVGVSSLAVIAAGAPTTKQLISPIFDARNTQLYAGVYRFVEGQLTSVIDDQHTDIASWQTTLRQLGEPITLIGETSRYQATFDEALGNQVTYVTGDANLPDAGRLGLLARHLPPVQDVDQFIPNYLRLSPAEAQWAAAHPGEKHTDYVEEV